MLSALKSKVQTKTKELVSTITHGQGVSKSSSVSKNFHPGEFGYIEDNTLHTRLEATAYRKDVDPNFELYRYCYYIFDDQEWKDHQKEISNLYNNDKELLKNYRKDMFGHEMTSYDANYRPVIIAGEVPMKIVKELYSKSDKIKFAALEENYDLDDLPFPVARLAIAGKDPVCLMDFLEASKCKEYGIDAITMCSPDENKTRGVRLSICQDEDGKEIKSYEILNGIYDMDLNWEVEGKKCEMKISVSADGSAKILKRNGVTDEEIYAHTEVMVGKQHDTKSLYEALGLQQGKSMEKIQPKLHKRSQPQKSKEIKELVEKNPEVKSALKEFASEVKEESSESVKPLTDITKANVKEAGSSMQR